MKKDFIVKWASQLKKGALTYVILKILNNNEFYGYELMQKVKHYTKFEIAEGTLYPLMNRLKNEDLVESRWVEQESGIPRKYYTLTAEGKSMMKKMEKYWDGLNNSINQIK